MTDKESIDALLKEIVGLQHSDPELAFKKNEMVLAAAQTGQYEIGLGLALNNKGNYYFWRDENEAALDYYVQADRILSKSDDPDDRLIAKMNIAVVFSKINEQKKSLDIYRQVEKEIEDKPVDIKHAQIYLNIDVVLLALGRAEEALQYAMKAYAIAQQLNHAFGISISANHVAGCYIDLNEPQKAQHFIEECFIIDKANNFTQQLCMDYLKAALITNKTGNFEKSIAYTAEGLVYLQQTPSTQIKAGLLEAQAIAYECVGQYQLALQTQKELLKEKLDFASAEKAKSILSLNRKYDLEKKETQLREAQLQKLDAELKAIKSQMNPHFAFNTLKTIDYQLEKNDIGNARISLNAFAQLMRATLEQSANEFTVIEDEVLLLENYIRLEKNALGDSFDCNIQVDASIDQGYERIPSIFVQPIVENAIKHGLRHKQGAKKLLICFAETEEAITVSVEDNGVGRQASAALNASRINHRSFAGNAMQQRVNILNEKAGYNKYSLAIDDLAEGTRVILIIKRESL